MAPRIKISLPSTEDKWHAEAKFHKVTSIHDLESTKSGSKMTVPQYLSLKTIWHAHDVNTFNKDEWPSRFGSTAKLLIEESTKLKRDNKPWREYLKALESRSQLKPVSDFSPELGCFAIVLQNQLDVLSLKQAELDMEKVTVSPYSPVAGRTRSKGKSVEPIPLTYQSAQGPKISRDSSTSSERQSRSREATKYEEPKASSDVSETKSHATVFSAMNFDVAREERDATVDEQVVNTAAIALLQSLFIHNGTRNAYWSAQRKGFCLGGGKEGQASFKAITDGHLKVHGEIRSAALLEVKARKRPTEKEDFRIEMQESAQMALWIYEETSSFWTSKNDPSTCQ
jgi:hypothetical protein